MKRSDREAAAVLCAMKSAGWRLSNGEDSIKVYAEAVGATHEAIGFAWDAFRCVESSPGAPFNPVEEWAEAEALLRSGWSPE